MFLHLGDDTIVALEEIISINDYKGMQSAVNQAFLHKMREENKVVDISENTPKSFIVTSKRVFLSAISSVTLKKRTGNLFYHEEA